MSFEPYLAYEASAGSGKTFALVVRYISLLFLGANPSKILTLTFTNKSAKEMSERIKNTLANLEQKEAELEQLCSILQMDEDEVLEMAPKIYKQFLKSDIKIATIDSFVTSILRGFAFHFALLSDFEISLTKDTTFIKKFLKHIKSIGKYDSLVTYLFFKDQRLEDTVKIFEGFYARDFEISSIKAKEISDENYDQRIGDSFTKIKESFLECKALSNAGRNLFKEYTKPEELLKRTWVIKNSLEDHRYLKKCFKDEMNIYFYQLKDDLKSFLRQKEDVVLSKLLDFYKEYKNLNIDSKRALNELSFNDISNLVYEILTQIDKEFLYFRLDARIEHLLMDEFQDTSLLQFKILEPIIAEITAGIGTSDTLKSFFYVGDIKQSIYRFRGGNKKLFHFVAKKYYMKIDKLDTNYRSSKNVVEFVNKSFVSVIENYTPQLVRDGANTGYVEVLSTDDIILSLLAKVNMFLENGVDVNDIAILCYTNKDSYTIKETLKNIPSVTTSSKKLIDNKHIKAIINYIKYLHFKEDIFKFNFLSLTSQDLENDVPLLNKNQELMKLIKEIIDEFNLVTNENEIFKFLDEAIKCSDIEEFVSKIDSLEALQSSKSLDGVNILTIHKSKGLEFEHLIIIDRLTKKSNSESFLYDYEDMQLKDIWLNFANRSELDDEYKEVYMNEKENSKEDETNTLYVAFTRAKNSLCIVKNSKNSIYDSLNLSDIVYGEIVPSLDVIQEKKHKKVEYKSIQVRKQNVTSSLTQTNAKNLRAIYFGTAVHYMLENIHNLDVKYIEEAYLCTINRFVSLLDRDTLKEIKKRVSMVITNVDFKNLIDGEIIKEKPVKYEDKNYQIDLIIEDELTIKIIDYKTSSLFEEKYIKQLKLYENAMKEISSKNIECYICYLLDNKTKIIKV